MFSRVLSRAKARHLQAIFQVVRQFSQQSKMPTSLVILSDGAEEMETTISADVLVRGGVSGFS